MKEGENLVYKACIPYKFQGTMLPGGSERAWLDDYPIYRYADCLLLLAEAKALLGEDIATEINTVRRRAYGETYFEANKATVAYPNEKGGMIYVLWVIRQNILQQMKSDCYGRLMPIH